MFEVRKNVFNLHIVDFMNLLFNVIKGIFHENIVRIVILYMVSYFVTAI